MTDDRLPIERPSWQELWGSLRDREYQSHPLADVQSPEGIRAKMNLWLHQLAPKRDNEDAYRRHDRNQDDAQPVRCGNYI